MPNEELIRDLVEVFKKHAKRPEDAATDTERAVIEYFTEDKIEDMTAGLVKILEEHRKK